MRNNTFSRVARAFGRALPVLSRRRFSAWQVELTTRCRLSCVMCIRSGPVEWVNRDMPLERFRTIVRYLGDVRAVVLEGWGEPLLHPDLIDCIRLVKDAGAEAGFVTSGKGLTEAYSKELVRAGTDFIGFSLAGARPRTHNAIRVGSDLDELTAAIRALAGLKENGRGVRIHLAYLMLKENIDELPDAVRLAAAMGVPEIVILNQVMVTCPAQDAMRVHDVGESASYLPILNEAAIRAADLGVRLRAPSLFSSEVAICDENPLANLYIGVDGDVAPCVYLNPPVKPGQTAGGRRLAFGNIFSEPFEDIWDSAHYRGFRACFERRKNTLDRIYSRLGAMGADYPPSQDLLPPAPGTCTGCPKIMGA
jgi:MoaA/NifB/PqqE/SkfB family radical SAM enzyme